MKTTIRFSINTPVNIALYEHGTPELTKRLKAARLVAQAGYPLGFLIAPIIMGDHWEKDYINLLEQVCAEVYPLYPELTYELITHRFTPRAKEHIQALFPNTRLPLAEKERRFKYGQFGYGKYLYPTDSMKYMAAFFTEKINQLMPEAKISYFV